MDLAYDGTDFSGWAAQRDQRTVQGELEKALETVIRRPVPLTVAGRTDAGVHALGQTAHFDLEDDELARACRRGEDLEGFARRIESLIAHSARGVRGSSDVVVRSLKPVSLDFDARFSALRRHYQYLLCDQRAGRDPRRRAYVWQLGQKVDIAAMNRDASALLGEHDFLSYCRPKEGGTTIRTLERLEFVRQDSGEIAALVSADAFCRSMVRSLVSAAVQVGAGRREEGWMHEALQERSRSANVGIAPAHGLTLVGVDYPDEDQWAQRARVTRARRDECSGCSSDS